MNKEKILLVENEEAGRFYSELIEKTLNIDVIWVKNKKDAINAVENNNIICTILDQRLEAGELGTEVFKAIRHLNHYIKTIMISGQARGTEVGEAIDLGLHKYVNKSEIDKLPQAVIEAISVYKTNLEKEKIDTRNKVLFKFSDGLNFFRKYKVILVSRSCLNKDYLFEDKWKEKLSVEAGQSIESDVEIEFQSETIVEEKNILEISNKYTLKSEKLKNSLNIEGSLNGSHQSTQTSRDNSRALSKKKLSLSLPPIPEDVTQNYLASKSYQINQVFMQYSNIISIVCPECNCNELYTVISYIPTEKFSKRQINIYKDGNKEIIDCGIVTL